jgi:hypothetical protein
MVKGKKKLCEAFEKNKCEEKECNHKECERKPRSLGRPPGIYSVGRAGIGEVSAVSEISGWEKVRVQIDSGAIDTVGPRGVAKAFAMKETTMSKKGIGFVAANGSSIKNYGEKRVVGYTEDGEGVSLKITCAEVDKVLGSVHRFNAGGNVVVLDGRSSYMQNKATGQKTRIEYEGGQYVMYLWVPSTKEVVERESERILKGNRFALLAMESAASGFTRQARNP